MIYWLLIISHISYLCFVIPLILECIECDKQGRDYEALIVVIGLTTCLIPPQWVGLYIYLH